MKMEQNEDVKESGSGYFRFIIQKGANQIALRRLSDWDAVGRAAATAAGSNVRKDTEFYDYIANITERTLFDGLIMVTIILNALFMALETDYDLKYKLFGFFEVDGWTDLQQNLDDLGMNSSRIFTIVFILIGYFIFFNMFIGVVIMEIQHTTKRFENEVQSEREASLTQKKHAIIQRQKNEIRNLIQSQTGNFTKLVEQFNKSLRHTDYTVMEDLCTSMSFIDIYLTTLDHQDTTANKLQQLYSEAILILSDLLEEDLIEMEQKALRESNIKMRA
ncbi:cation channel sperm-associated protein 3 isoform X2 [Salmo salar]|uniref:Cation channel sperm-associated protein 3 isoform X2 n=1 Tax=Salmo salar TaxID=8030 RepID=A0A1S3RPW0_SALSA|nr:cation channel sperm-associated protein 3 isoform X2 [Salmo salar]|eukprot:XP_014053739.1 PREDICTED: cation channel sperm-associated protein 3 isoform X4 [Salmo salar]